MKNAVIRCAVVALFLVSLPLAAQTGAWTAVGSTGDIDEASLGIFAVNVATLQHLPAAAGTVVARYNVTNTYGGGITDLPAWNTLEMTYFDNSAMSFVSASLYQVNHCTGITNLICTVTSVDAAAPMCLACNFPAGTVINFGANLYVVEARVNRMMNNVVPPQLIGLRIF